MQCNATPQLRHPQPLNRALLIHHLARKRVRSPPAQFDALARAALDALHADCLGDAVLLLRAQTATGLGVEFEGVALLWLLERGVANVSG